MAPSVIFINGFNTRKEYWDVDNSSNNINIQKKIAKKYQTLTFDMSLEDYNHTFGEMVQQLDDIFSTVPPPYVLVGHSIGGLLAQFYTYHYPDKVQSLFLIDSTMNDIHFERELESDVIYEADELKKEIFGKWLDDLKNIQSYQIKKEVIAHFNNKSNNYAFIKAVYNNDYQLYLSDLENVMRCQKKLTSGNPKSELIIHIDSSHNIHHVKHQQILNSLFKMLQS